MRFLIGVLLLVPAVFGAGRHSGSVRAADQFIPGATVTARQGGAKVVAYTDENGRYTLDLTPGIWEVQVEMFGFKPKSQKLDVGATTSAIEWTLEVPRIGEKVEPPPAAVSQTVSIAPPTAEAKKQAAPSALTTTPST